MMCWGEYMRDIPFFTTGAGIAALTLSEIPYKQCAYIKMLSASNPAELLQECIQFCCAAGAEHVFATGHSMLEQYPLHTALLKMNGTVLESYNPDVSLFPLQEKTLDLWQSIYNDRMRDVANAATMTNERMQKLLIDGNGYFVHRKGELLGIGIASGENIDVIISVVPGEGETVLRALCGALSGNRVCVEVASANNRGMKLYERVGFVVTEEISRWYSVR